MEMKKELTYHLNREEGKIYYEIPHSDVEQIVSFSIKDYIFHLRKFPPNSSKKVWTVEHPFFTKHFSITPKVEIKTVDKEVNNELFYIHISKTGGSSIESAGYDYGINWGYVYKLLEDNSYEHHSPLHKIENKTLFTSVRHPYNRIISFLYTPLLSFHYINEIKTEEGFNNKLKELIEEDHIHMLPCYDFVYHNNKKVIPHVIRMEDGLNEGFDKLMFEYNCPVRLNNTHANKSSIKGEKWGVDDINPANIDLINKRYEKDFEYFGYTIK